MVGEGAGEAERVLERHGGQLGAELLLDDDGGVLHPGGAHVDGALGEDGDALEEVDEAGAELAEEDVVEEAAQQPAVVLERLE